jgi:broad specificity phosphatase PhoE
MATEPVRLATPPEPEPLADAIRKVSEGMQRLLRSGLNKNAVVVLLHDYCRVGKRDIEKVLDSLGKLEAAYCVKEKR